jgi:hypothetical protein
MVEAGDGLKEAEGFTTGILPNRPEIPGKIAVRRLSGKDIISSLKIAKTTKITTFPVCTGKPDFPRAILMI